MKTKNSMGSVYLILLGLVMANAETTANKPCQQTKPDGDTEGVPTPSFNESLSKCLKSQNVSDMSVKVAFNHGFIDIQCAYKNWWAYPDSLKGSVVTIKNGPTLYRETFGYLEPNNKTQNVTIDKNCYKAATSQNGSGFYPVLWYCLDFCENQCKKKRIEPGKYPVSSVNCSMGTAEAPVCEQKRKCQCKDTTGQACGMDKEVKVGDILAEYNKQCLNCRNSRFSINPSYPRNRCINETANYTITAYATRAFENLKTAWLSG